MRERSSLVSRTSSRRNGDAKARSASGVFTDRDTSIDASPPHRRCIPPALRGAGGGHPPAAARRGAGGACLPNDLDPVSAERARRRCRLTMARVPRRLTRRAAHAGGQARRRRSERRASGRGRSRAEAARSGWSTATNRCSCASRPGRTRWRNGSACRRRRSTSGAEARVAWLAFDDSGSVARVMTSTNRVGARVFVGDRPSGFADRRFDVGALTSRRCTRALRRRTIEDATPSTS